MTVAPTNRRQRTTNVDTTHGIFCVAAAACGRRLLVVSAASGGSEMRVPRTGASGNVGDPVDAELVHRDGASGTIRVTWIQRSAKTWTSYRVLVNGDVVGRVRQGEPATIEVGPGRHEVVVKHWWYETNSLSVEVAAGSQRNLYAGTRIMSSSHSSPRQMLRWYRENSVWLADHQAAPAVEERPLEPRWQAFRRFMLVTSPAVFLVGVIHAAVRRDPTRTVIAVAFLISSVLALAHDRRRRRGADEQPADPDGESG